MKTRFGKAQGPPAGDYQVVQESDIHEADHLAQPQVPRSSTNLSFFGVAYRVSNDLGAERDAFIADENAL
jgi:hypothetical protein